MGRPRRFDVGDKVDMLTIIDWKTINVANGRNSTYATCKCDCGNIVEVCTGNLGRGSKSCGCLKSRMRKACSTKHGESHTRLYGIWKAMRKRCLNPNDTEYHNYGGRGIMVCEEWCDYFAFRDWALANGYSDQLSIDRSDVDGHYRPDNCRWATPEQQGVNRRNNVFIEFEGERRTLSEWSKLFGIPAVTIAWRLKHGWEKEKAFGIKA